jgi:hypothetical protein
MAEQSITSLKALGAFVALDAWLLVLCFNMEHHFLLGVCYVFAMLTLQGW